jgi:hypothetical protein
LKKTFFVLLLLVSYKLFSENFDQFIYYFPDEGNVKNYFDIYSTFILWENDKIKIDDITFDALYKHHIGKNMIQSLLVEIFFAQTKNKNIQTQIINYIDKYDNSIFGNILKKIYSLNMEYINLFYFQEVGIFKNELKFLLFDNDWQILPIDENGNFSVLLNSNTNNLLITFKKYENINITELESIVNSSNKYNNYSVVDYTDIVLNMHSSEKIEKIYLGTGFGQENINILGLYSGIFKLYLFNKENKNLYEINYSMNMFNNDILYEYKIRVFNYLFCQLILCIYINI